MIKIMLSHFLKCEKIIYALSLSTLLYLIICVVMALPKKPPILSSVQGQLFAEISLYKSMQQRREIYILH